MKHSLILLLLLFVIAGCSKEDANLEINNAQAFAFDLGETGWELNATAMLKNMGNDRNEDEYSASVLVVIELIGPEEKITEFYNEIVEKKGGEAIKDIPLEAQYEIDSTYTPGTYTVKFSVKDNVTGETVESSSTFELIDEDQ